jgi:hypothetical protein
MLKLLKFKRLFAYRHVTVITLASVMLCVLLVQIAYAHLYSGYKWQYSTVTWYIGGGEGVPSSWYSQYRSAASTWTNAPGSFALNEVSPPQAQGNLGAKRFSRDPNLPDLAYGASYIYYGGGYVIAASSYLNTDYTSWKTDGSSFPDVRTVAIHEFGHWVRFIDSCSLSASVMCANGQVKWSLTTDDKNDLKAVYP